MIEFSAKYYDGVTTRARAVTVRVAEPNLVHIAGPDLELSLALTEIRIEPRLGNTVRSLTLPDGAKCESDDHAAVDALERLSGKGRAGALLHTIESNWRAALGAVLVLFALIGAATKWGIPLLAERIARSIPPALAYDLGRGTLAIFDNTIMKPSQLPVARRGELDLAFAEMAKHYPALPLTLNFRRGLGPNAFALPDGTVVVTDELVELAKNDEEILSVVAHEIGHVHHRHSLRMALESSTVLLLASAYLGDVTQLTTMSAALPGVYAQAHYSRTHETEADTFALEYLRANKISPQRFADILRALSKAAGPDPKHGFQYLASHPPTPERIQRFER